MSRVMWWEDPPGSASTGGHCPLSSRTHLAAESADWLSWLGSEVMSVQLTTVSEKVFRKERFLSIQCLHRFPSVVLGSLKAARFGRCGRGLFTSRGPGSREHNRSQGQTQPCGACSRDPLPIARPHLLEFREPPKIAGPNTMSLWWSFTSKPQKIPSVSTQLGLAPFCLV